MNKNEQIWLYTQNPSRCPRFAVVVTFLGEIPDDFHVFRNVSVPAENQLPILGRVHRFFRKSDSMDVKQKHTFILQTKSTLFFL